MPWWWLGHNGGMGAIPSDQVGLLIETVKWWILMLATVTRRLGNYLDEQGTIDSILKFISEYDGKRPITDYFPEAQIEDMKIEREYPEVVRLRTQADGFMVASALYQINGLLKKLSSHEVWRGELASTGNRFREVYREDNLGDLRNFIEHADVHIAEGKLSIATDYREGFGMKMMGSTKRFPGGVDTFYVFGTEFQVFETVNAAREVFERLPNGTKEEVAIVWD